MNSLERMRTVLNSGVPDVCPVAPVFWGAEYAWKVTGRTLLDQMFGPDPGEFEAAARLCDRHGSDWICLTATDGNGWLSGKEVEHQEDRVQIRDPATGETWEFEYSGRILRKVGTREAKKEAPAPFSISRDMETLFPDAVGGWDEGYLRRVHQLVEHYGTNVFVCGSQISPFVDTCYRMGCERAMLTVAEHPAVFLDAAERSLERQRAFVESLRGSGLHGILVAESYASCDMISPAQYRKFAFPFQKAMVDAIHEIGMYAVMFSTGDLMPILEEMRGLGADALIEEMRGLGADALIVEEDRKGVSMDIGAIRDRYGKGRCLFGNVSSERLLAKGNVDEICGETLWQIQEAGKGGAFVVSNGGSPVCDDTPPEAVDAMVEAAHSYRYD